MSLENRFTGRRHSNLAQFSIALQKPSLVAERLRKLASHNVAGKRRLRLLVLKGQRRKSWFKRPFRTRTVMLGFPATTWLGNFPSRFATNWFLQSNYKSALHIRACSLRKHNLSSAHD